MTIQHTAVYDLAYADTQTPVVELAEVTRQVAATLEAALIRGGIAPPAAQDLAQLAGRVATLEGKSKIGLLGRAAMSTAGNVTSGTTEQRITGAVNGQFPLLAGRGYRAVFKGRVYVSAAGQQVTVNNRIVRGTSVPAATASCVGSQQFTHSVAGVGGAFDYEARGMFQVASDGTFSISPYWVPPPSGTATLTPDTRGIVELFVEDVGVALPTLTTIA